MVLQVLDLVSTTSEPFYGDCPAQTYTDLDINASGHTTCTVVPQGNLLEPFRYVYYRSIYVFFMIEFNNWRRRSYPIKFCRIGI